jgi:hypothetical protein
LTTIPNRYRFSSFLFDGSSYHLVDSGGPENITTSGTSFTGTISSGNMDLSIPVSANATGNRSFEGYMTGGQTTGNATLIISRITSTTQQIGIQINFLRDNSTVAQRIHDFIALTNTATQFPPEWFSFRDENVPAGQHTWKVVAQSNAGNTGQCRFTGNVYLRVREVD